MAKPVKPIPAAAPASTEKPKNRKLLVIGIAVAVLIVAGGAGWFFTRGGNHAEAAKAPPPVMEPKFIVLEPFTVNLQHEEADQFLQIGITLKISEPELEEKIKLHLPEIRSRLLLLLSAKRASELTPAEGKRKLAQEIIAETGAVLGLRSAPSHPVAPIPKPAAQSGVSGEEAGAGGQSAPSSAPAEAPPAAPHVAESNIGIDVLFTSFIIQ